VLITLLALLLLLWLATATFTAGVLVVLRAAFQEPPHEAMAWAVGTVFLAGLLTWGIACLWAVVRWLT
jgi:hypothetical protein